MAGGGRGIRTLDTLQHHLLQVYEFINEFQTAEETRDRRLIANNVRLVATSAFRSQERIEGRDCDRGPRR